MDQTQKILNIVGGGLAGVAAAQAARNNGYQVNLFERSGVLGGRMASLFEPKQKQWIDIGQHIFLGCCTEILTLHKRLALDHFFDTYDTLPFATQKQQQWTLQTAKKPLFCLPKKIQLLPSLLTMPALTLRERLKTGILLNKLNVAQLPDISAAQWLLQHHVPQNAQEAFWKPLIFSALSELPEYAAIKALQTIVRKAFLAGQDAMTVYLPKVPLRTIYHDAVSRQLAQQGVELHFYKRLRRLHWTPSDNNAEITITALEFSDGTMQQSGRYILAMPAFQIWPVLEASGLPCRAEHLGLGRLEPGAISTVHLWLNRPVLKTGIRHCILSGGIGQFLCKPLADTTAENPADDAADTPQHYNKHYYTVVISAAHRLLSDSEIAVSGSADLASRVLEQLRTSFGIPDLRMEHCRTTTCFEAVFSPKPDVYGQRSEAMGLFSNGAIAGDWTQTGLPSTMEGAVRSGLKAVEGLG